MSLDKVVCTVKARIPTVKSYFNLFYYKTTKTFHLAIVFNKNYSTSLNRQKNILNGGGDEDYERVKQCFVRIHSCCLTGEILGSMRCDCGEQLETSLEVLAEKGGVLVYLNQVRRIFEYFRAKRENRNSQNYTTLYHYLNCKPVYYTLKFNNYKTNP
jgi:GTP cyclohydrolase II